MKQSIMKTHKPHILLVEDEENHTILIRDAFDDWATPMTVIHVSTLEEARNHLAGAHPDLIITDIRLPDGNGLWLLDMDGSDRSFPIIVMTAYGDQQIAVQAMKSGASDYVIKSAEVFRELPHLAERVLCEWKSRVARELAEEAVREEKAFTENALNSLRDIFFVFDLQGKFLKWNNRITEVTGYEDDEIGSMMQPGDFFSEEDRPRISKAIGEALRHGTAQIEADVLTKDGWRIPYEWSGSLLRNTSGDPLGVAGCGRDVTKRKQLQEILARRNEELTQINKQLKTTVGAVRDLMDRIINEQDFSARFANNSLVPCWKIKKCDARDCPAHGREDKLRCWEIAGTHCDGEVQGEMVQKLEHCRKCPVYQYVRSDLFLELGETFNEMIAMLEQRHVELAKVKEVE